jgi:hypothetical protein
VDATVAFLAELEGKEAGDPEKMAKTIVDIVDITGTGKEFQDKGIGEVLRIQLGSDCYGSCTAKLANLSEALRPTETIARSADFDS